MKDGFIKVAAASPSIRLADPIINASACIEAAENACGDGVKVLVFPELALTGCSCGDLFLTDELLDGALDALRCFVYGTAMLDMVSIIGLPIAFNNKVYNCAAVVSGGQLLGLVPKNSLADNAGNFESRIFAKANSENFAYTFDDSVVILGRKQIFVSREMPSLKIGVEFGNDLFSIYPPSVSFTAAGATVVACCAANPETVGSEDKRKILTSARSLQGECGYIYANLGDGESTSSTVYAGHCLIAESGKTLNEKKPFDFDANMVSATLDIQKISKDRRSNSLFATETYGVEFSEIEFDLMIEESEIARPVDAHPFIPDDKNELKRKCERILELQAHGLARRIEASYSKKIVVGISGGLDSCLAILVMASAIDLLGRDRKDIIAVTMPCFGTTKRTKNNATVLCEALGVDFREVNIFAAVEQHFKDIGHEMSDHNVVYENAQARERTQVLMDIANAENGIVVGTGDLSELALGWATYNGDHMSMYGVNASLPKTLIRHVVRYYADNAKANGEDSLADSLYDILDTPVSPELLPANENGEIAQVTEDLVGPYELHDFYIYNFLKYGYSPKKLFRLAKIAFEDIYEDATLLKWLEVFTKRFFAQQFKRSCLPDGIKVGSIALSSNDFKMPSDVTNALWMKEINELKELI